MRRSNADVAWNAAVWAAAVVVHARVFDITLHAWDLARALGMDYRLDPALVEVVLRIVENGPPGMGFGINALGRTTATSSPQATLLDLTGRDPA
jgi:hypothetical protein